MTIFRDDFSLLNPYLYTHLRHNGRSGKTFTQLDLKDPAQNTIVSKQLNLTADVASVAGVDEFGNPYTFNYKSGGLFMHRSLAFRYGRIRIKYKPALGKGLISTAYLLPFDNELPWREVWPPEIDLFETSGSTGTAGAGKDTYYTVHYKDVNGAHQQRQKMTTFGHTNWREVEVLWTPDFIEWYEEGVLVHRVNITIDTYMYLIMELRVGAASWPAIGVPDASNTWPQTMMVEFYEIETDDYILPRAA